MCIKMMNENFSWLNHVCSQTLWFRPCLSKREMIDLMWFSWMMFKTSGLSIKTQYSTSRMPGGRQIRKKYESKKYVARFKDGVLVILWHFLTVCWRKGLYIPEEASRRSSLLTSQSRLSQNRAQLERFPLISDAVKTEIHSQIQSINTVQKCKQTNNK